MFDIPPSFFNAMYAAWVTPCMPRIKMKLYEITNTMRALMDTLSDAPLNGDDSEALQAHQAALAQFESITQDLHAKLRAYTAYALELQVARQAREAHMDIIVATVLDRMRRANERDQKKESWLLEEVQKVIEQFHVQMPLKFPEFSLALQKMPPTCEISDPRLLPANYWREIPASREPDKRRVLANLKQGLTIPGARLAKERHKLVVK